MLVLKHNAMLYRIIIYLFTLICHFLKQENDKLKLNIFPNQGWPAPCIVVSLKL